MNSRYEIQDILSQDDSGIAFHAEDRESKREVVLRRFFPFGVDGGGFEGEDQIAYEVAVQRMKDVAHPALRSVIDGGSDPVDGMPFLVTEWHEGEALAERLKIRPLSPPSAKALADLALECCQVLSDAFQKEAVWIETNPQSVILGNTEDGRKVTFRISPLRWLADANSRKGLQPIAKMIEMVTGWNPRTISNQAGDGLGWWLKTMAQNPEVWNLTQAKAALHEGPPDAKLNATVTVPALQISIPSNGPQTIPAPAPAPRFESNNTSLIWPWVVVGSLTTSVFGILAWQSLKKPPESHSIAMGIEAEARPSPEAAAKASIRAAKITEALRAGGIDRSPTLGETFTIEALVDGLRQSRTKKTAYLTFAAKEKREVLGLRYRTKNNSIEYGELEALVGKRIRITGLVVSENGNLMIALTELDQIEGLRE